MLSWLEGKIDFEGQRLTEYLLQITLVLFSILGFLVGFLQQNLLITWQIFSIGFIITGILVLPAWPYYNKHPVQWLPEITKKKND
ncbi:hypothetical protein Glove_340g33 [Diversispora epigaea]|uniref:Signal peptidase complex subunit 1 n=1 Tax=Diversispora epigaea TaxID=1348612 RepID=A0A397HH19_9GLOM|nr:hypothetical protein Glove_340g33 [Diversispora epigaea]